MPMIVGRQNIVELMGVAWLNGVMHERFTNTPYDDYGLKRCLRGSLDSAMTILGFSPLTDAEYLNVTATQTPKGPSDAERQ